MKKQSIVSLFLAFFLLFGCIAIVAVPTAAASYTPAKRVDFEGHTYEVYEVSIPWTEARAYCESAGGHLVTITSAEEQTFVESILGSKNAYWMGGCEDIRDSGYKWITYEPMTYTNWGTGQPDRDASNNGEDKVMMYRAPNGSGNGRGKWNDLRNTGSGGAWGYDYTVSMGSMGFICEYDNSMKEYIIVQGEKTEFYGAEQYKLTNIGDLYQKAQALYKALNAYLETLRTELQKAAEVEDTEEAMGRFLRQLDEGSDEPAITLPADFPESAIDAVYIAYGKYLKQYVDKAVEMNKIDLDDPLILIGSKLVQDIQSNITGDDYFVVTVDGCRVTFTTWGFGNMRQGSVTVKKNGKQYIGVMTATTDAVADGLADYVKELRDVVYDAAKQTINGVLGDLADVTGFAEWEKSEIRNALKKTAKVLEEKGFGDVYRTAEKCRQCYELIGDIASTADPASLEAALKKADTLCEKLETLRFDDDAVTNRAIEQALSKIITAKQQLVDALYDYLAGKEPEEDKGFFDTVTSWIQSVIQCPVDFEVLDSEGRCIGAVADGVVTHEASILIEVSGDVKTLYVPDGMTVSLRMTATDEGTMTYVTERFENGSPVERYNFYDLPLTEGRGFNGELSVGLFHEASDALPALTVHDKDTVTEEIYADERIAAEDMTAFAVITTECTEGGIAVGAGSYPRGDSVELTAIPDGANTLFVGWFDGEEVVSTDSTYRFTAREDMTLRCVFTACVQSDWYLRCTDDSDYVLKGGYVLDIGRGTTIGSIVEQFENANVTVTNGVGETVEETATAATGMTVEFSADGETVTDRAVLVVTGDTSGDGLMDLRDAVLVLQYSMMPDRYPTVYPAKYMDFNGDGGVDVHDALRLFQHSMYPDVYPIS